MNTDKTGAATAATTGQQPQKKRIDREEWNRDQALLFRARRFETVLPAIVPRRRPASAPMARFMALFGRTGLGPGLATSTICTETGEAVVAPNVLCS